MVQKWIQRIRLAVTSRFSARKLVGHDLQGNRYYEEARESFPRRTVELADKQLHLGQISSADLAVQWRAWLRHTRTQPPSLEELEAYEIQKARTIANAKRLDVEWEMRKLELKGQSIKVIENKKDAEKVKPKLPHKQGQQEEFQPDSWSPVSTRDLTK